MNKLEYKARWYGKEIIKIDGLYPSSQICSVCGHRDQLFPKKEAPTSKAESFKWERFTKE